MRKTYGKMTDRDTENFKFMEGAIIEAVKMTDTCVTQYEWQDEASEGYVEGGLTFIVNKGGIKTKVILGYTELGVWLEHREELGEPVKSYSAKGVY